MPTSAPDVCDRARAEQESYVDQDVFRREHLIVRLTCTLYNESGQVDEICENRYDANGRRIGW